MRHTTLITTTLAYLVLGLNGQIGIHDPSTVVQCDGRFYTYGTGGTALVSSDGWDWKRGTNLPRRELAPDVVHIGDRYYVYTATNVEAQPRAVVNMIWMPSPVVSCTRLMAACSASVSSPLPSPCSPAVPGRASTARGSSGR